MAKDRSEGGPSTADHRNLGITEPLLRFADSGSTLVNLVAFISWLAENTDAMRAAFVDFLASMHEILETGARQSEFIATVTKVLAAGDLFDNKVITVGRHVTLQLQEYEPLIFQMVLCRVVDDYLIYLTELLSLIFETKPQTLRSSEAITLEFVLSYSKHEELIKAVVERKVNELSYQGMRALCKYLNAKLGFVLFEEAQLDEAVRLIETRNLIVHNCGVINDIFLRRVPSFVGKPGDVLRLDAQGVGHAIKFFRKSAFDIDRRAVEKFGVATAVVRVTKAHHLKVECVVNDLPWLHSVDEEGNEDV